MGWSVVVWARRQRKKERIDNSLAAFAAQDAAEVLCNAGELRTGCEVKFAPADLSSSVRDASAMGVTDTVPVSKMASVFVPLLLHLAPAEHTIQSLEIKGPRTLTWGCTNAQSGSLGRWSKAPKKG